MSHPRLAVLTLALFACSTRGSALARDCGERLSPYTLDAVDEAGRPLPAFSHQGRTYVLGEPGARYLLRVRNKSAGRIEVVTSVDGRDVLDGEPASVSKRGYLVPPFGQVLIDGYRLSVDEVAAFRFGTVGASYAARMGDSRDVGVIGAAVFTEAIRPPRSLERVPSTSGADDGRAPAAPEEKEGAASRSAAKGERRGLGTVFGERRESRAIPVDFERESSTPVALLSIRYDDRAGLISLGIDVDGRRLASRERFLRETADPFRKDHFADPPPGWDGR
ncbi:MAG TPA: hypothetical protein VFG53_01980 [Anaeromyxobacter sp.]|nr:hypothetical protein [Anaeromyxobacter sp.]